MGFVALFVLVLPLKINLIKTKMKCAAKHVGRQNNRRDSVGSGLKCWAGAGAGHFRLRGDMFLFSFN